MNKNILLTLFLFGFVLYQCFGQSDISMNTNWYNRATYNPAFIARTEYSYLFANTRQQWVGAKGAPQIYNLQFSTYLNNLNSAFGVSITSDNIGASSTLYPMFNYAYRLANNRDWQLSLGVSAGVIYRHIDQTKFEPDIDNDPTLTNIAEYISKPDANIGVEFQNTNFIIGLSTTHLLSIVPSIQNNLLLNSNYRYGYFIYKNTSSMICNYYTGVQISNKSNQTNVEINGMVRFKKPTGLSDGEHELFDLGLSFRIAQQLSLLFGVNISKNLKIGYAYNQSFITGYYGNTTHELMLEYRIPTKASSTCTSCMNQDSKWYR